MYMSNFVLKKQEKAFKEKKEERKIKQPTLQKFVRIVNNFQVRF